MDLTIPKTPKNYIKKFNNFLAKYISLFSLAILVIILFIGVSFLWPKYINIKEGGGKAIAEKNEEQNLSNALLDSLNRYTNAYNSISQEDRQKIDYILPDSAKDVDIYAQLEKLIKDEKLVLTSLSVSMANSKAEDERASKSKNVAEHSAVKIRLVDISMTVLGVDYKKTKELLKKLENNLRLYDITDITFSPGEQSASFKFNAYYFQ